MVYESESEKRYLLRSDYLEHLKSLRLMDDDFLTKVFDGHPECIELVLRIILEDDQIEVSDVKTQVFASNLLMRSVRFDVFAKDRYGRFFNVEIQRDNRGAEKKRARYNGSLMDVNLLEKGTDPKELPETYVIFIAEKDKLMKGFPIYHIEKWILESAEPFGDESHIIYVNGSYLDETPLGKLMQDFHNTKPEEMHYDVLAERVRFFKETKEGNDIMCRAFEELAEQVERETRQRLEREAVFREERLKRETTERVERETTERVQRETTERVEKKMYLESIQTLMETLNLSRIEAMHALRISEDQMKSFNTEADLITHDFDVQSLVSVRVLSEIRSSIRFCTDVVRNWFGR